MVVYVCISSPIKSNYYLGLLFYRKVYCEYKIGQTNISYSLTFDWRHILSVKKS